MLPDKSVLIGQKLVENVKIKDFKCDILSQFQTMFVVCTLKNIHFHTISLKIQVLYFEHSVGLKINFKSGQKL